MQAHIFQGYWEDIGTIRAFFEANLALTNPLPPFSFFDATAPIYTHMRFLPGSKINGATVRQANISDGCIISDANIERAVIGLRSIIKSGSTIKNSIIMGADYYEEIRPARAGSRRSASGRTASWIMRSWTKMRAWETALSSPLTESRTSATGLPRAGAMARTSRCGKSATASLSFRRAQYCRTAIGCDAGGG